MSEDLQSLQIRRPFAPLSIAYVSGSFCTLASPVDAHEQANAISCWLLAGRHHRYFAPATLLRDQPKDRSASLQPVSAIAPGRQGRPGRGVRSLHPGDLERASAERKEAVRDDES